MTKQISSKDWQTLSEYLDGQLPNRERTQIEARLQTSTELRTGLEELKRTRAILRSLPRRRAPRNFTLTAAMVPERRPAAPRAFPYLRLASAFASFLLVMTFIGDLAIHNLNFAGTAATSGAAQPRAAAPAALPAPETPPTFMKAAPANDLNPTQAAAVENSAATQAEVPPAAQAQIVPPPTETPEPGARSAAPALQPTQDETQHASEAMTAAPLGLGGGPGPEATEAPGATEAPQQSIQMAPETPAVASDAQSTPNAEVQPYSAAQNQPAPEQTPQPVFDARTLLRPAEIIFALIAVLTGIAAYIIQRTGRT